MKKTITRDDIQAIIEKDGKIWRRNYLKQKKTLTKIKN